MMNQYVCRCCLKENPQITYKIFDTTSLVLQELQECLPAAITYEYNDGLPQIICDICWLRLREMQEFRQQCLLADRELRNRYVDYKNKAVEEVLNLVEKFRQQDSDLTQNNYDIPVDICENLYRNLEVAQELPDLDALERSFITDSMTNEFDFYGNHDLEFSRNDFESYRNDFDFSNSSPDSGIFEEDLYSQTTPNLDQILQSDTNNDFVFADSQLAVKSSEVIQNSTKEKSASKINNCPECDKKFTRNFQLKLHLISVHNIGNGLQYSCDICHKTFASTHSLSYHQKSVHYQQKPYACTECERQFILKSQLVSHMRVHTGQAKPRIFECKECGKKWPTKSDLRTHMRTHDPNIERPFKCDQCEKSFFTRGHLTSHLLVHTGEKPYICEYCQRSYQSVGNLNNHLLRRHGKDMKNRDDCGVAEPVKIGDARVTKNKGVSRHAMDSIKEQYQMVNNGFTGDETILMEL